VLMSRRRCSCLDAGAHVSTPVLMGSPACPASAGPIEESTIDAFIE